tara:strand:+ start:1161 stop:2033 length:873 start_codon:yes stop_codon:yes gene_type:complete
MVKKNNKFQNICLFTSSNNEKAFSIGKQIQEILSNKGCKIFYDQSFKVKKQNIFKTYSDKYILKNADLIIAIGGDGAMLGCSRKYGSRGIPILGINLGRLGFLTDIAPDEITSKLLEVIGGKFVQDKRFFLSTSINNKKLIALNEIVIHSGAIAQLIQYDLYIDNVFVYRQKADGLIINSPTGSTAYSLSGGGPIVHPALDAITLLPMFPHSLSSSPLIISADSAIKIVLSKDSPSAQLSLDSHNLVNLKDIHEINICKSKSMLELVHPIDHDFFAGCRNKLGWSSTIAE